jgi:hypothetical protein
MDRIPEFEVMKAELVRRQKEVQDFNSKRAQVVHTQTTDKEPSFTASEFTT